MASTVLITGNTYPVKDQLKALGGRWDGQAKGWRVPAGRADEARALVSGSAGGKASSGRTSTERKYMNKYGWDGKRNSSSYYTSGMYDEES